MAGVTAAAEANNLMPCTGANPGTRQQHLSRAVSITLLDKTAEHCLKDCQDCLKACTLLPNNDFSTR